MAAAGGGSASAEEVDGRGASSAEVKMAAGMGRRRAPRFVGRIGGGSLSSATLALAATMASKARLEIQGAVTKVPGDVDNAGFRGARVDMATTGLR